MTVYPQAFGGSAKVARELFSMLHPNNPEFVTEEELKEQLDDVLKLYLKKKDDDKSGQWTTLIRWISARAFFHILTKNGRAYRQHWLVLLTDVSVWHVYKIWSISSSSRSMSSMVYWSSHSSGIAIIQKIYGDSRGGGCLFEMGDCLILWHRGGHLFGKRAWQ